MPINGGNSLKPQVRAQNFPRAFGTKNCMQSIAQKFMAKP